MRVYVRSKFLQKVQQSALQTIRMLHLIVIQKLAEALTLDLYFQQSYVFVCDCFVDNVCLSGLFYMILKEQGFYE